MLCFGPGRIRTLVFMATDSSHRLTMGKTLQAPPRGRHDENIKKIFFSETTRPRAFIFCV